MNLKYVGPQPVTVEMLNDWMAMRCICNLNEWRGFPSGSVLCTGLTLTRPTKGEPLDVTAHFDTEYSDPVINGKTIRFHMTLDFGGAFPDDDWVPADSDA